MNSLVRIFAWTICFALCLAQGEPSWSAEPEPASCCAKPSTDANREFQADTFSGFFTKLFDGSDYPARWYCGNWTLETGWLHVISDVAIFGAYFTIPVVLLYFLLQRPDIPFPKIIWLFAAFILACGFGHLVEAGIFWWPVYRFSGLIKAITAGISWVTVLVMIRLMPKVLKLPSMAILGQQLKIANQRLDSALEAGNIGVWQWEVKSDAFTLDDRTRQMHGLPQDAEVATLDAFLELLRQEDRLALAAAVQQCVQSGANYSSTYRVPQADGSIRYIQLHAKRVADPQGRDTKLIGVCIDQTELTESHNEITKLSLVASSTRHSVVITDASGVIEWVNNAFTKLTGYSAEEAIGRKPGDLLQGPETSQLTVAMVRRALADNRQASVELLNYTKDKRPYWIALEIEPVFDDQQRLTNFIATQVDITDQVRRTEELISAMETAESANQAKSQFLANMSHEIRTPLNGIIGFTDLLLHDSKSSPQDRQEYLETVRASGQHLLTLINEILDLSKIESGQVTTERTPCSPQQILSEVAAIMRPKVQEKQLQFGCIWESKIPPQIVTNGAQFKQLLLNIVGNAVKFTSEGEIRIVARLLDHSAGCQLAIDVTDTGIGIPAEKLEVIFKPFSQADESVTRRFGGTGLGLAISKNLAEMLGGSLTVESVEGKGSTFHLVIEAGVDFDQTPESSPPTSAAPVASGTAPNLASLQGVRALVVDDGEANRRFISVVLDHADVEVSTALDGKEAVRLAATQHPDVILLDMQMPVMDGYAAAQLIRLQGYEGPIVAVTAHAMQGDREKCLEAGCSGYITKPLRREELLRTVAVALQEYREQQAAYES